MWIRTQDRKRLVDCKDIEMLRLNNGDMNRYKLVSNYDKQDYFTLGTYPTEARAFEVLEEIQQHVIGKLIIPQSRIVPFVNGEQLEITTHSDIQRLPIVYEMPKE